MISVLSQAVAIFILFFNIIIIFAVCSWNHMVYIVQQLLFCFIVVNIIYKL